MLKIENDILKDDNYYLISEYGLNIDLKKLKNEDFIAFEKEKEILIKIFNLPELKNIKSFPLGLMSLNEIQKTITLLNENELIKKLKLSNLLVFDFDDGGYSSDNGFSPDIVLKMKPNDRFPMISSMILMSKYNYIIGGRNFNAYNGLKSLTNTLKNKENELESCNDTIYVKGVLDEFKKEITKFKVKNKDELKIINANEKIFFEYLDSINLKDFYSKLELVEVSKNKIKMK